MPGPLEGIRIVDLAAMGPGPHCNQILGDLGAKIVKVEEAGEPSARRAGARRIIGPRQTV